MASAIVFITSLLIAQSPAPSEQSHALAGEPRQFMRFVEDDDGGLLQILVANYKSGEAELTLFGCVHVADRQFYEGMQQRFKAYDALLYELVAEPDMRPYPDMPRGGGHWISVVQGGMDSRVRTSLRLFTFRSIRKYPLVGQRISPLLNGVKIVETHRMTK